MRIRYDASWTDEEWRAKNFSETDIASSRVSGAQQPTVAQLIKAAKRFGNEGILESAIHLSQSEYRKVENALKNLEAS